MWGKRIIPHNVNVTVVVANWGVVMFWAVVAIWAVVTPTTGNTNTCSIMP